MPTTPNKPAEKSSDYLRRMLGLEECEELGDLTDSEAMKILEQRFQGVQKEFAELMEKGRKASEAVAEKYKPVRNPSQKELDKILEEE